MNLFYFLLFHSIMNIHNQHLFTVDIFYLSLSYLTIGFISLYMMMKYESRNCLVWSFSLWSCALISSFLLCLVLYNERFYCWIRITKFDRFQFVRVIKKVVFTKLFFFQLSQEQDWRWQRRWGMNSRRRDNYIY